MCSNNISCTFDCVLAKSEKIIVVKCKLQISRQENVSILTKDHLSESVLPEFSLLKLSSSQHCTILKQYSEPGGNHKFQSKYSIHQMSTTNLQKSKI